MFLAPEARKSSNRSGSGRDPPVPPRWTVPEVVVSPFAGVMSFADIQGRWGWHRRCRPLKTWHPPPVAVPVVGTTGTNAAAASVGWANVRGRQATTATMANTAFADHILRACLLLLSLPPTPPRILNRILFFLRDSVRHGRPSIFPLQLSSEIPVEASPLSALLALGPPHSLHWFCLLSVWQIRRVLHCLRNSFGRPPRLATRASALALPSPLPRSFPSLGGSLTRGKRGGLASSARLASRGPRSEQVAT